MRLQGHIEICEPGHISGWARDLDAPHVPLRLDVHVGRLLLGSCLADQSRADLDNARICAHGFAFNGPPWDFPDSAIAGLYARRTVYRAVKSIHDFEPWIERIRNFPPEVFDRALSALPPAWIGPDLDALEKMLQTLLRRGKRIQALLEECRNAPGNPFPEWR